MPETTKAERGLQVVANFATIIDALRGLTYIAILIAVPVALVKVMPILDRLATVAEESAEVMKSLERKVDEAFEGLKPMGKEAITKGVETLKSVDAKKVGESITDAFKRKLKGKK